MTETSLSSSCQDEFTIDCDDFLRLDDEFSCYNLSDHVIDDDIFVENDDVPGKLSQIISFKINVCILLEILTDVT